MTTEVFDKILENCSPHKIFNSNWSYYSSREFADTLLPNVGLIKGKAIEFYDGGNLLPLNNSFTKQFLQLAPSNELITLSLFSYPIGVKAGQKKNSVQPKKSELCIFFEIDIKENVYIYFKSGEYFKNALRTLMKDEKKRGTSTIIDNRAFKTSLNEFQTFFNNKYSHFHTLSYVGKLLGYDLEKAHQLTLETIQKNKCKTALGTTKLDEVKSVRLEKEIVNAGRTWELVRKKFIIRDKLLNELLNMSGLPQTDIDTLTLLKDGKSGNLSGLWNYMRSNVYSENFDYKIYIDNDFLNFHRNYEAAIEDENNELNRLTHPRYNILKKSSKGEGEFQYYYLRFVKQIISIKEEKNEKNRFDSFFEGAQVKKALKHMTDIEFYPSELKALAYQESGDLTNATIAGIKDEKIGLRIKGTINNNYIGIAQIGVDAMKEGTNWAKDKEITFVDKSEKDLRKDPENAIILLACILASNYDLYLSKAQKYNSNDCLNWKKCIIGSYNWSGPSMMYHIRRNKTIDWDTLSSKTEMPTQTKNYVPNILARL